MLGVLGIVFVAKALKAHRFAAQRSFRKPVAHRFILAVTQSSPTYSIMIRLHQWSSVTIAFSYCWEI